MEQIMTEFDKLVKEHENEINNIQRAITPLIKAGLKVTDEDLTSLSYEGARIKEQAVAIADKEAEKFKVPFRRNRESEAVKDEYFKLIETAKNDFRKVLKSDTFHPLNINAYHIQDGKIFMSEQWLENMRLQYEPEATEARKKATALMNKAIAAIEALNAFVADNPYIGKGVTSSLDDRRCLIWLDGDGNIHREDNNLKFI